MDQLKVYLGHLKKHHFWVLTALVLILALFGWNSASSQLASEYSANWTKIDGEFKSVSGIISQTNHPNESFEQEAKRQTAELRRDVEGAWNYVYADQKAKVLKWPTALGKDFLDWMNDPDHYSSQIPHTYREMYNNYVRNEFPRLLEIVDAKPYWEPDDLGSEVRGGLGRGGMTGRGPLPGRLNPGRGPAVPPGAAQPEQPVKSYTVIWDKKDQQAIADSLNFATTPDSQTVRFCQENLWVYHALLDAIALVNKGATGNHNAKIKEIIAISIAHDASAILLESLEHGRIMIPDDAPETPLTPNIGSGVGTGEDGEASVPTSMSRMGDEEGRSGIGGGGTTIGKITDHQRYLDDKGLPLPTGTPGPAEFKRMPIVMRLKIDQREISDLLVALANSPLPVDIRQVRINTKMPGYTNTAPSMFGGKDAVASSPGDTRQDVNVLKRDTNMEAAFQNPFDVGVELHGIIYIFNPPDKSLRTQEASVDATDVPSPAPASVEPAVDTPEPVSDTIAPAEDQVPPAAPVPDESIPADGAPMEPEIPAATPTDAGNEFDQASPPVETEGAAAAPPNP